MTVKSTVRSAVRSAIRGTVRSGGSSLPEWTHIYEGLTTFGELYSTWQPSGNDWEVEVEGYDLVQASTGRLLSGAAMNIYRNSSGQSGLQATINGTYTFYTNPASSYGYFGVSVRSDGSKTVITDLVSGTQRTETGLVESPSVTEIGRFFSGANFFKGQIHRIQLLDNDDPSNSIDINTVKRSKDAPSASDNLLINSLGSVGEELVSVVQPIVSVPIGGSAFSVVTVTQELAVIGAIYEVSMVISNYSGSGTVGLSGLNNDVLTGIYGLSGDGLIKCTVVGASSAVFSVYTRDSNQCTFSEITIRETTRNIGEIKNLTGYQPVLKGGGLNRENVPDKFEAFNGDLTNTTFDNGVSVSNKNFTAISVVGNQGSYAGAASELDTCICIADNKAVVKSVGSFNTNGFNYTTLQGTDEQIQKGFEYPNVFRVIKPSDTSGEYEYYNTGGTYPWIP